MVLKVIIHPPVYFWRHSLQSSPLQNPTETREDPINKGFPRTGWAQHHQDAPAQPGFWREPAAPSILSAPPFYVTSPGTTQSPPDTRLSWLPAPGPPKGRGEETCLPAMLLYGKGVFGFHFTFVFTLHLQVFHKKCLLECELRSLSLSDRATHALTASPSPPADEWKFPVKRAAAHSEWGGWGGGGRRGLCSLAVQRRQAFLKRRNRSKWAPLPRLHGLSLPDSGFPEAVDCWPSNHPRHGKAPVSSDIYWVSYIWKTTKPAAERLHILGHCHRKRERDQNSPALRPRHEAPTCKNGVRVLAWAWCWQQSTRTGKR